MKIHFAQPSFTSFQDYETNVLEKIHTEFRTSRCVEAYTTTDDPEEADLILLLESATFKWRSHIENLKKEPLLQRYAAKVLTYNFQDGAAGFLDGVYVHSEKKRFVPGHHKAWSTLWPHNELIYTLTDEQIAASTPQQFCSFRGSISSTLRKKLVAMYGQEQRRGFKVTLIDRWYNHKVDEKQTYLDEMLLSQFVLCPKGICSYTPRFFETMAVGRVPVLIADEWVPPDNLDLEAVAVVVPEKRLGDLEEILNAKKSQAAEMGRKGRLYWKKHFARDVRLRALIDVAVSLQQERKHIPTLDSYLERWESFSFAWANGWTLPQRAIGKLLK